MKYNTRRFTNKEIEYLKANYKVKGNTEIARVLGRSIGSIRHKLDKLGLIRTREELKTLNALKGKLYGLGGAAEGMPQARKVGEVYFKDRQYYKATGYGRKKPLIICVYHDSGRVVPYFHELYLKDANYTDLEAYRLDNIGLRRKQAILDRYALSNYDF